MNRFFALSRAAALVAALAVAAPACADKPGYGLAIHGGAGTITRANLSTDKEQAIRAKLNEALDTGHAVLKAGGSSLDAVVATLQILEDSPLFNAGIGAVYTADGAHELDASIMDGASLNAGAVAGVRRVRSPIQLARDVMDHSAHVMLSGDGAEAFAVARGMPLIDNSLFDTDFRLRQLEKARARETSSALPEQTDELFKFGTVGAVALDRDGNLAAGTSTGGMTNKRYGRIGDSPVIGAGTYANNASCAVSSTGHGEYFIRYVVAYDVCAQMQYGGLTLAESADRVVNEKLVKAGGSGGLIAIDRAGNIALPFNTAGMYRGWRLGDNKGVVQIYKEP